MTDELAQARTSKKEFLEKIEAIITWKEFMEEIQPYYYKGERGNKPYELELMLRIFILQNLYDISDMGLMNEIIDSRAFSDFCGVDSSNQVPGGDTIGRFRNLLQNNNLQEKLFVRVIAILKDRKLILKKGTIVDSTIIEAPSSTKNQKRERDPDAKSTKKGNNWHFGYKAHIGVDRDTGIVHHLKVTGANEHDSNVVAELMHGEEETLHGNSGYLGSDKKENAITKNKDGKNIKYIINRRPSSIKKLSQSGQSIVLKRLRKQNRLFAAKSSTFSQLLKDCSSIDERDTEVWRSRLPN